MPTVKLDLEINTKNESAVKRTADQMRELSREASGTSEKMAKLADSAGRTATTLARSADAFGLNANALRSLDDVMDVAELGFGNLTKSAVGFNAASIGVAGAGLAIGTAIGSWLRTFPAVTRAADDLANSLYRMFTGMDPKGALAKATDGLDEFAKRMGEIDKQLRARRPMITDEELASLKKAREETELMKKAQEYLGRQANTLAEARKVVGYFAPPTSGAGRRASPGTDPLAEQMARDAITQQAYDRSRAEAERQATEQIRGLERVKKESDRIAKEQEEERYKLASDNAKRMADEFLRKQADAAQKLGPVFRRALSDLPGVILGAIQGGGDVGGAIGSHLGGALGKGLEKSVTGVLSGVLGKSLGGALGALAPGIGSLLGQGLGSLAGRLLGGLFGGEGKKVNDLRDQFISASGGLAELGQRAAEAGLTLDHLLRADRVSEFEAAVKELNGAFDLQKQAQEELQAAVEKYGFTIEELGPKYRQQALDKEAGSLIHDWELLAAAGADHAAMLERMGPAFTDYINNARAAGVAIPENLRGVVEELIKQGKILDENGNAFDSAASAGISFTESLTEGLSRAIDAINRLVAALGGVPAAAGAAGAAMGSMPAGVREGEMDRSPMPIGAAKGYGPAVVPDMGRGLGPLIQTHAGEGVLVVPRTYMRGSASSRAWPRAFHAASGFGFVPGGDYSGGGRPVNLPGLPGGGSVPGDTGSSGSSSSGGSSTTFDTGMTSGDAASLSAEISGLTEAVNQLKQQGPAVSISYAAPSISITGTSDPNATAQAVSRALDDDLANLKTKVQRIALGVSRRI